MKKILENWISSLLVLLLISLAGSVNADTYMKQKRHTDAMKVGRREMPAQDLIEEIWITEKGFRSDNVKNSTIMLFEEEKIITIDHEKKTYTEMPMSMEDMLKEASGGKDEANMAEMQKMMGGMMKMEVSVKPLGPGEKINGWSTKKYLLDIKSFMGTMTQEIWATEELKMDSDLYERFSSAMAAVNPAMRTFLKDMVEEMKKIKGVQVRNVFNQKVMGRMISSYTEMLEYKIGKAPSDLFKMPSGYKKKKIK